ADNRGQQVVEVVSNAPRQQAYGLDSLSLEQLLLQVQPFFLSLFETSDVFDGAFVIQDRAVRGAHCSAALRDPEDASIFPVDLVLKVLNCSMTFKLILKLFAALRVGIKLRFNVSTALH